MILTTFAALTALALADPDPLAPARAGQVQCYEPDVEQKTCESIGTHRFEHDGRIVSKAEIVINDDMRILLVAQNEVYIRDGAECSSGPLSPDEILSIEIDGEDVNARAVDPVLLRARVGMVFQKPNPFPKTIYENVAYGPRIHGLADGKAELDGIVEASLKRAGLWDEVADRLHSPGTGLSGGQQQRLVIARAIAVEPEVILMDEPCSALDPIATARIEELIDELRERYCIVIVTHSMAQAARVSQRTAFFHLGRLIEMGDTEDIFTNPRERRTLDYITGRFG